MPTSTRIYTMAIRVYKPTTPGRRNASVNLHVEVTKKTPEKSLLAPLHKTGARNNQGKITVLGRGGGHQPGIGNGRGRGTDRQFDIPAHDLGGLAIGLGDDLAN